jgi:signal transduction histidine kinase
MRRWFSSLAVRLFLLLLGGVVLAGAASLWIGEQRLTSERAGHVLDRAADLIAALNAAPPGARPGLTRAYRARWVDEAIESQGIVNPEAGQALNQRLDPGITATVHLMAGPICAGPQGRRGRHGDRDDGSCSLVVAALSGGSTARFVTDIGGPPRGPGGPGLPWLEAGVFLTLLAGLAWIAAKMAAAPMARLADAAQRFGRNLDTPPVTETGPSEVKAAAAAFNRMQSAIRDQVAEKTQMLAAITHDLRTPLTRLRLRAEQVADPELQERMKGDLSAMDQLIAEGLELARAGEPMRAPRHIDLDALVGALVEDAADAGQPVMLNGVTGAIISGDAPSLTRAIANLIDNAIKYGSRAEVVLEKTPDAAIIRISDDGPGLDEEGINRAGEPFWRAEASRSRETGGAGLGLAIAKRIVARHLGQLTLANRREGGLAVTITLPVAAMGAATG